MNSRQIVERVLFFRAHPAFAGLGLPQLLPLARRCASVRLDAGAATPKAPAAELESVLFITAGSLMAERVWGPEVVSGGETAGLLHVLSRRSPPAMEAVEDVQGFSITREDLEDVLEQDFEVLLSLLGWVCQRSLDTISTLPEGHTLHGARGSSRPSGSLGSFVDRLGALAASSWFPAEHLDALAELANHVTVGQLERDETLWNPGDEADHFVVITSGSVRCDTGDSWHCHGGDGVTVGEYEALAGTPRRFTAVAEVPTTTLRIETDAFVDILEDHPQLAVAVLEILSERCLYLASGEGTPP